MLRSRIFLDAFPMFFSNNVYVDGFVFFKIYFESKNSKSNLTFFWKVGEPFSKWNSLYPLFILGLILQLKHEWLLSRNPFKCFKNSLSLPLLFLLFIFHPHPPIPFLFSEEKIVFNITSLKSRNFTEPTNNFVRASL